MESVNGINARELPTRSSKPYNVYITVYLFLFLIVESVSHFNQFYDDGHVMQSNDYFLIKDYAILSFISSQCSVKFVLKFIARIIGISFIYYDKFIVYFVLDIIFSQYPSAILFSYYPKVQGGIDIKYIKY